MPDLQGYRGAAAKLLSEVGVQIGDVLDVQVGQEKVRGTLVPRYEHNDENHIVIKLKSGYNVGIATGKISRIVRVAKGEAPKFVAPQARQARGLPDVSILGTGGTIASRVDYRTGAVHPATTSEELYSLFPELSDIASIKPEIVLSVYSENLGPQHWETISKKVSEVVARGVSGAIVTMGTDTMGYAAAALSFALQGVPIPVFVVGSQRSSDRPSSDAFLNLVGAATMAAQADFSGVYVVMHADSSDDLLAVHRGTRVRKNHTSARDAFESIGTEPVAFWSRQGIRMVGHESPPRRGRDKRGFEARPKFDQRVALIKFFPSMLEEYLRSAFASSSLKGAVLEGTGLGHINSHNIQVVERFIRQGGIVCMTSQCLWGRVDLNVYDTGRDLLKAGVVPLEDMLPETAMVKLMWALANSKSIEETKSIMVQTLAGEVTERTIQRR